MILRIALVAAVLGIVGLAVLHPAPKAPAIASLDAPRSAPDDRARPRHREPRAGDEPAIVYVVGAVRRPGLYRIHSGDRDAQAVAMAGGLSAAADPAGVNLAQHAGDGEEIYVPALGESAHRRSSARGASERRSHRHTPPPEGSVDPNTADATQLAAVPGIGRSIAARIVELREREGSFSSLDELLDVAGMTQSRLERARPYLRDP